MSDESADRYAADDFLRAAHAAGMPRSLPWLRSLIREGLLDQPQKHGIPGKRGGRAPGTWPRRQYQLLLALLDQMQKGVTRTAVLCNVPVSLWLYFGSEYIPVRQVRRALATYGAQYRTTSAGRGSYTANQVALLFAGGPDMSRRDRNRLVEAIVTASRSGSYERDPLIAAAERIFDPEQSGRVMGPDGARVTPETWGRVVEARITALDRLDGFEDWAFEDARLAHLRHLADYHELQPKFARDRQIGEMFEPLTWDALLKTACIDALTILGFRELARERNPSIIHKSAARLRQQPAATPRGGTSPHGAQHATARRRANRGSPQRAST